MGRRLVGRVAADRIRSSLTPPTRAADCIWRRWQGDRGSNRALPILGRSPDEAALLAGFRTIDPHVIAPVRDRRDRPFVSPSHGAARHKLWILHNPSSVIIPHMLSMTRNLCCVAQNARFPALSTPETHSASCEKSGPTHTGKSVPPSDSRITP